MQSVGTPALIPAVATVASLAADTGPTPFTRAGFRLHPLKGDRRGLWAVTVRANWRIVWRFDGLDAAEVDLVDYY